MKSFQCLYCAGYFGSGVSPKVNTVGVRVFDPNETVRRTTGVGGFRRVGPLGRSCAGREGTGRSGTYLCVIERYYTPLRPVQPPTPVPWVLTCLGPDVNRVGEWSVHGNPFNEV